LNCQSASFFFSVLSNIRYRVWAEPRGSAQNLTALGRAKNLTGGNKEEGKGTAKKKPATHKPDTHTRTKPPRAMRADDERYVLFIIGVI
jgi:hypothetical protein